jgi:hypothetical protein
MPRSIQRSLETNLLHAVLEFLAYHKIYAWRNNVGGFAKPYTTVGPNPITKVHFIRAGKKGLSDITGILPDGLYLAIECKAPDGRLRPEQKEFLDTITKNHGVAGMVKSVDDVEALLRSHGYL